MSTLKELGEWLAEDDRRTVLLRHSDHYLIELVEDGNIHRGCQANTIHGALDGLTVPSLKYEKGDILCEFCYRVTKDLKIPKGWDKVLRQSYICNHCIERFQIDGIGVFVARGGCYADRPDPRSTPAGHRKAVYNYLKAVSPGLLKRGMVDKIKATIKIVIDSNPDHSARKCAELVIQVIEKEREG